MHVVDRPTPPPVVTDDVARHREKAPRYRVTAVNVGNMRVDASEMSYGKSFGTKVDIPVWCAAIEGGGRRVIVDTGISDPQWTARLMCPTWQAPEQTIDGALDRLGWSRSSVDVVVNTHLHHDHCANNSAFPNAEFFVSLAEWEFAQAPIATQRVLYNESWLNHPLGLFDYTLVDRDHFDVAPGLRLVRTPGHTPGHQSLLVQTDDGVLCVSGDAVNSRESLADGTPCGLLWSTEHGIESVARIRDLADAVLMSHDTQVTPFQEGGFPRTEALQAAETAAARQEEDA
ncbi:N-acyl homoserine lactonase family protein [Angustibacter aerolatus]|uniref:MBL fold metallo-hydrolase n=1 Tax=Angustibacter aerolatus TaxID=1162965 RepID=A0ABQ6JD80_9ACTN|nr:N-acyl homoserine lactonase family protein [Angustibacter aerolatus]GMA85739.1 MBL fold metallo-hydrolase [Angustibacter aerolatus]